MGPVSAFLVFAVVCLTVWLKIVRPVRGDLAWKRQGERVRVAGVRRRRRAAERAARA